MRATAFGLALAALGAMSAAAHAQSWRPPADSAAVSVEVGCRGTSGDRRIT